MVMLAIWGPWASGLIACQGCGQPECDAVENRGEPLWVAPSPLDSPPVPGSPRAA